MKNFSHTKNEELATERLKGEQKVILDSGEP